MNTLTPAEAAAAKSLITLALAEDLGTAGDRTAQATIPATAVGRAAFVARAVGIVAGLPVAELVLHEVDPQLTFTPLVADGTPATPGKRLAIAAGPMRSVLAAERTALNFLQRLSGVASQTRHYVEAVAGLPVQILDTRKTTPGWRLLEKYAVRLGGGHNHRLGLHDGILIKDNHLAALGGGVDAIPKAVAAARAAAPELPVEVEVDTPEQFEAALRCRPDIILLDNMGAERVGACVRRRDEAAPGVKLESSGGVTLATLRALSETGVDRISIGALTHSAVALDIALDYEEAGA
jgi:nicotinate-nucleotide pyrophosphorylase (carboxylating)